MTKNLKLRILGAVLTLGPVLAYQNCQHNTFSQGTAGSISSVVGVNGTTAPSIETPGVVTEALAACQGQLSASLLQTGQFQNTSPNAIQILGSVNQTYSVEGESYDVLQASGDLMIQNAFSVPQLNGFSGSANITAISVGDVNQTSALSSSDRLLINAVSVGNIQGNTLPTCITAQAFTGNANGDSSNSPMVLIGDETLASRPSISAVQGFSGTVVLQNLNVANVPSLSSGPLVLINSQVGKLQGPAGTLVYLHNSQILDRSAFAGIVINF